MLKLAFTLLELLMVVAIVGILGSIAYPSYLGSVYKAKRADATRGILECASILERRFTLNRTYTSTACVGVSIDEYSMSVAVTGLSRNGRNCTANSRENCYLISATSLIDDSDCKTLTYNELNVKAGIKSDGVTLNTEACWRTT